MSVESQVKTFVVDNFLFGEGGDDLSPETSFTDAGIIDSTGVLELVDYLEETFGITVEDHEMSLENLDSIGRVASYVVRKTGQETVA